MCYSDDFLKLESFFGYACPSISSVGAAVGLAGLLAGEEINSITRRLLRRLRGVSECIVGKRSLVFRSPTPTGRLDIGRQKTV